MSVHLESPSVARPRGRIFYGWYIVAASVAMNFYLSITFFQGFQAFFLPILEEFKWSRTEMSGAFSLRQLETGMLAPVIGILVDRWGPRKVILIGVIIGGGGMIFLSSINSILTYYVAFMVISIGMSGASHGISWPAAVSNWFHRLRGRAVGLSMLGPVVSGPFVVSMVLLEEAAGWRTSLLVLGAGLWVVGIPLALVARSRPEPYGYLPDGATLPPEDPDVPSALGDGIPQRARRPQSADNYGLSVRQVVRVPSFWVLTATFAVLSLGVSGFMVHQLPLFEGLGFSSREGAIILGIIFFLSGVGRMAAGALMDAFDLRFVLAGAVALHTLSFALIPFLSGSWWLVMVFSLIFGASFGSTIPARPIIVRELFGTQAFGTINGLMQGIAFGSGMIGPIIMGAVYDSMGTYTPAIIGFTVLMAVSIPLPLLLRPSSSTMANATHSSG